MLRRDCEALEQKYDARIVDPGSQHGLERETAAAQVLRTILFLDRARAFIGKLVGLVADVELSNIALFRQFDSFLVGEFGETPEYAAAVFAAMMKAVQATLLLYVANGQVRLTSESLNRPVDCSSGFASILLIGGDRRR